MAELNDTAAWFFLVFLRVATALRLLPMLGAGLLPISAWLAASAALSLGLAMVNAGPIMPLSSTAFAAAAFGQIAIGAVIGTAGRLVFAALEIAGGLASMSIWPLSPEQRHRPDLATAYGLLGLASLVAVGGHRAVITALSMSLQSSGWPLDAYEPGLWIRFGASLIVDGVLLALPLLAASLIADGLTGLLDRLTSSPLSIGGPMLRQLALQVVFGAALGLGVAKLEESCGALLPLLTANR